MKLESLKSSKFEAFKGTEVQNLLAINGGAMYCMISDVKYSDKWDKSSTHCWYDSGTQSWGDMYYNNNGDWTLWGDKNGC